MSFCINIRAGSKAEALAAAHAARKEQNVPHPVLDFIEHALHGVKKDGPITIHAAGHLSPVDSDQVSNVAIFAGPSAAVEKLETGIDKNAAEKLKAPKQPAQPKKKG